MNFNSPDERLPVVVDPQLKAVHKKCSEPPQYGGVRSLRPHSRSARVNISAAERRRWPEALTGWPNAIPDVTAIGQEQQRRDKPDEQNGPLAGDDLN